MYQNSRKHKRRNFSTIENKYQSSLSYLEASFLSFANISITVGICILFFIWWSLGSLGVQSTIIFSPARPNRSIWTRHSSWLQLHSEQPRDPCWRCHFQLRERSTFSEWQVFTLTLQILQDAVARGSASSKRRTDVPPESPISLGIDF